MLLNLSTTTAPSKLSRILYTTFPELSLLVDTKGVSFYVLLTVHLSIVLVINQLNAQILLL